jgi:protein-S-isoprenylcysteine O-methyltransferase Ste14
MEAMIYIGIGVLGFVAMNLFDLVSIKPLLWVVGCGMLLYAIMRLCLVSHDLPLEGWPVQLGWVLLTLSFLMILMALFVNLPFRRTYITAGASQRLIKTGLYALVRHPGVYWVAAFFFSFVLIFRSSQMLIGAIAFTILNTVFVIIEDKYFFVKMFEGYREYQRETPMLIPNGRSVRAFLRTLKNPKNLPR